MASCCVNILRWINMQLVTGNYLLDAVALFLRMMSPQEGGRRPPSHSEGWISFASWRCHVRKESSRPKTQPLPGTACSHVECCWHPWSPSPQCSWHLVVWLVWLVVCLKLWITSTATSVQVTCAIHCCRTLLFMSFFGATRSVPRCWGHPPCQQDRQPPTSEEPRAGLGWLFLQLIHAQIQSNSNNASPFFWLILMVVCLALLVQSVFHQESSTLVD